MPRLKKILSFSTFVATFVLTFVVALLISSAGTPAASADPNSCSQGFHAVGNKCVKTDVNHPVPNKPTCAKGQTPTQITKGSNKGKWYCKDKSPGGGGHGHGPAPATTPCNMQSGCDLVNNYVNPFINLLSIAFGLIAVISLILGGIQYSTSQGDPQKSAQAKSRISNTLLAIFAYLFLYAFLQFLIPGGLFN